MKRLWPILIIICSPIFCFPQGYPQKEIDLSAISDDLAGFQDEDANYEELYETLVQVLSNPIDLNSASADDLRMLCILTEDQINQFVQYREDQGKLLSMYELQAIPEFDLETIYKLQPFIKITDPAAELLISKALLNRIRDEGNGYLITRFERTFETKRGFTSSADESDRFRGSEDKYYLRFRTNRPADFSFGFTAEKDPGEQWLWSHGKHQYGFDYLSFHAQVMNKKRIQNLILGDFQCQFAQGLILGGAFGLGKGAETITTVRRSNVGFLPYTSVNESGYYRGIATTIQATEKISASVFLSSTKRDASIDSANPDTTAISSLQLTGLHRNKKELDSQKSILEQSCGIVLNVRQNNLDAGVIFQAITFNHPMLENISIYNQFTFQGKENINTGVFLNYSINNFAFFSEAAKSIHGGTGVIAGLISSLHKNLDLSVSFRKYEKNFYPFYANAFAEGSQPQNETGLYWGWKYQWSRKYGLAGYIDFFKFPWLGFRRYTPAAGHEWLLRFNYQPNRKILIFVQAREEIKNRNHHLQENLYQTEAGTKRNYWINLSYATSPALSFKSRVQYSTYSIAGQTTQGLALLQDISFSLGKFQVTARHALFDTEDYDNRHYVYENDVWLAYSLPAYYGVGLRNYLLLEYKISKQLSCWLRYSRIRYTDRNEIGSGSDLIQGNTKNDIKIQVMVKL